MKQQYENQSEVNKKKEGEVNIDYSPKKKRSLEDVGEYVDYEDVDE